WSSDVCSSDLVLNEVDQVLGRCLVAVLRGWHASQLRQRFCGAPQRVIEQRLLDDDCGSGCREWGPPVCRDDEFWARAIPQQLFEVFLERVNCFLSRNDAAGYDDRRRREDRGDPGDQPRRSLSAGD